MASESPHMPTNVTSGASGPSARADIPIWTVNALCSSCRLRAGDRNPCDPVCSNTSGRGVPEHGRDPDGSGDACAAHVASAACPPRSDAGGSPGPDAGAAVVHCGFRRPGVRGRQRDVPARSSASASRPVNPRRMNLPLIANTRRLTPGARNTHGAPSIRVRSSVYVTRQPSPSRAIT
jgi:hypothetical protein